MNTLDPGRRDPRRPKDLVHRVDGAVDRWVDRHRGPAADRVFYSMSAAFDHGIGWHVIGVLEAVKARRKQPLLRLSITLGVESFLTNIVVKSFFRRVRPIEHDEDFDRDTVDLPYGVRMPITSSFPSGHAAAAFTAAAVLSRGPVSTVGYHGLATLIAGSRVYVRLHHTSDVVAGAALGSLMGVVARRIYPIHG